TTAMAAFAGCASKPPPASMDVTFARPKGVELVIQGVQALDAGDRDRAIAILQAALQANPNLITPRNMLGDLYRDKSQYTLALDQYQALVYLDPYSTSNHYYLGLCYQFLDRIREAA